MQLDQKQNLNLMSRLGLLRDLTVGSTPENDPFLYFLADNIERGQLDQNLIDAFVQIARSAQIIPRLPIVEDALKVLNQMVDIEEGKILPPNPECFYDNRYFNWKELGKFTDRRSTVHHIVNKTLMRLNLNR